MLLDQDVFFRPFLARDATVSQAAAEVGCKPSVMLYRVGTFLRAGLLSVVREQPRQGRALKIYRSTHDAYFIPYATTPYATLEEMFYAGYEDNARRYAAAMAHRYLDRAWDGHLLYRNAYGESWFEGVANARRGGGLYDPERSTALDFLLDVHLTPEEVKALLAQLVTYLQRYQAYEPKRNRDDAQPYLFGITLLPNPAREGA